MYYLSVYWLSDPNLSSNICSVITDGTPSFTARMMSGFFSRGPWKDVAGWRGNLLLSEGANSGVCVWNRAVICPSQEPRKCDPPNPRSSGPSRCCTRRGSCLQRHPHSLSARQSLVTSWGSSIRCLCLAGSPLCMSGCQVGHVWFPKGCFRLCPLRADQTWSM